MKLRDTLARVTRRDPDAPTIKERFAATKEKYARTLRVHRALNAPIPKPEPIPRAALLNYATWLFFERRRVCADLYPHLGSRADAFVMGNSAADRWHFPTGQDRKERITAVKDQTGIRAVKVLDAVGVDWRTDVPHQDSVDLNGSRDDGERPGFPAGWPKVDAGLMTASGDLLRLDAAIELLLPDDDRSMDDMPGGPELEAARDAVLDTLQQTRADSLFGLQAKAAALVTAGVQEEHERLRDLARSLAADLIGACHDLLEPRADPILRAIEACEAAEAEWDRLYAISGSLPRDAPEWKATNAAHDALWSVWRDRVLKTTPQTGAGCRKLASFGKAFLDRQGSSLDQDGPALLALIAGSPAF